MHRLLQRRLVGEKKISSASDLNLQWKKLVWYEPFCVAAKHPSPRDHARAPLGVAAVLKRMVWSILEYKLAKEQPNGP